MLKHGNTIDKFFRQKFSSIKKNKIKNDGFITEPSLMGVKEIKLEALAFSSGECNWFCKCMGTVEGVWKIFGSEFFTEAFFDFKF